MAIRSTEYCGSAGVFTLSGQYRRGNASAIPHENVPLTLFIKVCNGPQRRPCAHTGTVTGVGTVGEYCSDGVIQTVPVTTDCSGNYSVTVSGSILAAALAVGSWIPNPAFSCAAPPPTEGGGTSWLPYILDPATASRYGCPKDIGGTGTALSLAIGDLYPDETGGITDGSQVGGACGYVAVSEPCMPCKYTTGSFFVTRPTPVNVIYPGDGTVIQQPQSLNGSYTLNFWENFYRAGIVAYYTNDGANYMVGGVNVHLTDSCGVTETVTSEGYGGIAQIEHVDWPNIASVTVSNWPGDCSPPLNTVFAGPEGPLIVNGPLTGPPIGTLPAQNAQIYPVMDNLTGLCIASFPTFGVKLQTCTGAVPERLQADTYQGILAVAWISSGALKTACHRSATRYSGSSIGGWETTETVETASADDIGMVYLPDESLYLCYQLSGTPLYRLNARLGSGTAWGATAAPNPAVSRHSSSGRAQDQAYRFRATGGLSTMAPIQFSQCRDNRGAFWTAPRQVTALAQGPYCGGIFAANRYLCLFTLSANTPGVGAANQLLLTTSYDGGVTWSAPIFTGHNGQCSGIAKTAQGALVAAVWGAGGSSDHGTTFLRSVNNGEGWAQVGIGSRQPPPLSTPPALVAIEDTLLCVWVSGDQPQFLASMDGGATWK